MTKAEQFMPDPEVVVASGARVIPLAEELPAEARPPEYSDEAIALRFTERYADHLRFVSKWSTWMEWTGTHWTTDDTLAAFDKARRICRDVAAEAKLSNRRQSERIAIAIASSKTVAAVERLARADRQFAAVTDQWDADPWRLNTPDGIVDLSTGAAQPHRLDAYCTKITAVGPGGERQVWTRFLERVTAGDAAFMDFLQRMAGYSLTGITREHALFFAHGSGRNGKGTFINALAGAMGNYATVAPMEAFTVQIGDRHPAELAMLRGARLVAAQETEEGRRWAEARIKALTGGDPITARLMRQDFFTFTPQFKLLIAGNHRPALRSVDEAIRRRLHLLPFTETISASECDPLLAEKLKAEWPGILAWAIQGTRHWLRLGLSPPDRVRVATEDYLAAEDAVALWLAECCDVTPVARENTATLFASWKPWAERAGEFVGSQKRFSQILQNKGFAPSREGGTGKAGFKGIRRVAGACEGCEP